MMKKNLCGVKVLQLHVYFLSILTAQNVNCMHEVKVKLKYHTD